MKTLSIIAVLFFLSVNLLDAKTIKETESKSLTTVYYEFEKKRDIYTELGRLDWTKSDNVWIKENDNTYIVVTKMKDGNYSAIKIVLK